MKNPLDPQIKALLEQVKAKAAQTSSPSVDTRPAEEKIAEWRMSIKSYAALGLPSEPVSSIENFDIPGPAGKIPVRLYVPESRTPLQEPTPVLIYFHGGGFVGGDLDLYDSLLRAIANRALCRVLSVDFRLAPEHPYPAANDDALAALNWVVDRASKIKADPERLAVGGDSSGGLLAAWVAQRANETGVSLRFQLLLYPTLDATTSSASWKELGTGEYLLSHAGMRDLYDAYLPKKIDRTDPKVSPLFANNLAGLAPALIITADHDPLRDEGNAYADKLKAANVPVEHTCWPGMIHGLASMAGVIDAGKKLIDQVSAALRKALETPKA